MNHDITIAVIGQVGAGKTTIAELVRDALRNKGIWVTLVDDEPQASDMHRNMREKALANRVRVTIKTVQERRD